MFRAPEGQHIGIEPGFISRLKKHGAAGTGLESCAAPLALSSLFTLPTALPWATLSSRLTALNSSLMRLLGTVSIAVPITILQNPSVERHSALSARSDSSPSFLTTLLSISTLARTILENM